MKFAMQRGVILFGVACLLGACDGGGDAFVGIGTTKDFDAIEATIDYAGTEGTIEVHELCIHGG